MLQVWKLKSLPCINSFDPLNMWTHIVFNIKYKYVLTPVNAIQNNFEMRNGVQGEMRKHTCMYTLETINRQNLVSLYKIVIEKMNLYVKIGCQYYKIIHL